MKALQAAFDSEAGAGLARHLRRSVISFLVQDPAMGGCKDIGGPDADVHESTVVV